MKKLFSTIVVLGLLFSGNAYADKPLKKILDLYSNKIDNLNKSQHLFYSTELAVASRKIKEAWGVASDIFFIFNNMYILYLHL